MGISFVSFVCNEENCVSGMIECVRPIVDEIIIVDTGSTDKTIEIITPMVDKVIHHPFTNFAEVRTFTARQATEPWVLMLDADERFLSDDLPRIKALTEEMDAPDVYKFYRKEWDNLENQPNKPDSLAAKQNIDWYGSVFPRLFKNKSYIKWRNFVHERMFGYHQAAYLSIEDGPFIHHYSTIYKDPARYSSARAFYKELEMQQDKLRSRRGWQHK